MYKKAVGTFVLMLSVLFMASCADAPTYYMKTSDDWTKIGQKIEKLNGKNQIDSVNIRSTHRNSLVSSIYILSTDENDQSEYKRNVEYIPNKKFELKGQSNIKKGALHSSKFNIKTLENYIDQVKNQLPTEYKFKDIHGIRYSADPFGEKYYIAIEVSVDPTFEPNDSIEVRYVPANMMGSIDGNIDISTLSDQEANAKYHVITYLVENNNFSIIKVNN